MKDHIKGRLNALLGLALSRGFVVVAAGLVLAWHVLGGLTKEWLDLASVGTLVLLGKMTAEDFATKVRGGTPGSAK